MKIWKFEFQVSDSVSLEIPSPARILHVGTQQPGSGQLCLWAMVEPTAVPVTVFLRIRGTGHPADGLSLAEHVGTVQDGAFVWHIFREGK